MKTRNSYTWRLHPGDEDIQQWLSAQRNISESLRLLVRVAIARWGAHDLQDLSVLQELLADYTQYLEKKQSSRPSETTKSQPTPPKPSSLPGIDMDKWVGKKD